MSRSANRSRLFFLLLAAVLLPAPSLLAQYGETGLTARLSDRRAEGVTAAFNGTTKAFKYLFTNGPLWIGGTNVPTAGNGCIFLELAAQNTTNTSQQILAEMWNYTGTLLQSSGVVTLGAEGYDQPLGMSFGLAGNSCTNNSFSGITIKLYSTTATLALNEYVLTGSSFDAAYRTAGGFLVPSGGWQRSVITSSFSFGSSAGVCATTPENSIKVSASNAFPGSPVFGDYGWQNSGTASNTDTCSGAAYADLFIRSSANISGAGKWTFTYQVPNGIYDVAVIYNASTSTAGPTTITVGGQTVANAVTTPGGANVQQANVRLNVGGNQILIGVSSATGTAVLNGVIITPVAQ